jgi:hypothetical protein
MPVIGNQRRSNRSSFTVTAEITDQNSRTRIARVRKLNLNGCFVEMNDPLPKGDSITIKVSVGKAAFEAQGTVVYSEPDTGCGVEFRKLEPTHRAVLQLWLLESKELHKSH